jgi:hypothetical protein
MRDPARPPVPPPPAAPRRPASSEEAPRARAAGASERAPLLEGGRTPRRSRGRSRRAAVLVALGVLAIVAVALALALGGGGSAKKKTAGTRTALTVVSTTGRHTTRHRKAAKAKPKGLPPAETSVSVLNGTETTGLARRMSTELQQSGYSQATPLFGRPPGSNEVTVVEYAGGHEAEAEAVAHTISVSHVQPMEQAVAALANGAKVVVIIGADRANTTSP